MLKMTIDNEEVVSKNNFTIKEEMLSPSSTILNNTYPKSWEDDKNYTSRFYYPKDYAKLDIQNFSITPEEAGTTIDIVGSATLTDVDTTKESRVLSLKGQTSQTGTPTPDTPIPINVVSGDNYINICGKNLLDIQCIAKGRVDNGNIGYASNTTNLTLNDNSFSFTTDANYRGATSNLIKIEPNTQYYFSSQQSVGTTHYVDFYDSNKTWLNRHSSTSGVITPNITFTTPSNAYYVRISFQLATLGTTTINNPMLEKGSTATTYEPYIGNSYPIYLGVENLFDKDNVVSVSITSKYYAFPTPLNAGIYTFSSENTASKRIRIFTGETYDASTYTDVLNWNVASSITFTTTDYINRIQINSGSEIILDDWNIKLTKGDHIQYISSTPIELCKIGNYQDYFAKSDGRNLFDKSTITTSAYLKEDGTLQTGTGAEYITSDFIPVKPNTTYYKTQTLSPRTKFYDKNKQVLDSSTYQDISIGGNAGSFTTPNNAYYFRFTGNVNTSTGININTTMVNEGSSALPYQPYGVGKWYLHKEIGKVVLDGSYRQSGGTTGTNAYYIGTTILGLNDNAKELSYSNMFKPCSFNNRANGLDVTYLQNGYLQIRTANNTSLDWSDNTKRDAWLNANKPIVYYVLATPTTTLITDTLLLSQLDDLESQ